MTLKHFTVQEWADYLGISFEEAFEPNIAYITEKGVTFLDGTFRPE